MCSNTNHSLVIAVFELKRELRLKLRVRICCECACRQWTKGNEEKIRVTWLTFVHIESSSLCSCSAKSRIMAHQCDCSMNWYERRNYWCANCTTYLYVDDYADAMKTTSHEITDYLFIQIKLAVGIFIWKCGWYSQQYNSVHKKQIC